MGSHHVHTVTTPWPISWSHRGRPVVTPWSHHGHIGVAPWRKRQVPGPYHSHGMHTGWPDRDHVEVTPCAHHGQTVVHGNTAATRCSHRGSHCGHTVVTLLCYRGHTLGTLKYCGCTIASAGSCRAHIVVTSWSRHGRAVVASRPHHGHTVTSRGHAVASSWSHRSHIMVHGDAVATPGSHRGHTVTTP